MILRSIQNKSTSPFISLSSYVLSFFLNFGYFSVARSYKKECIISTYGLVKNLFESIALVLVIRKGVFKLWYAMYYLTMQLRISI